ASTVARAEHVCYSGETADAQPLVARSSECVCRTPVSRNPISKKERPVYPCEGGDTSFRTGVLHPPLSLKIFCTGKYEAVKKGPLIFVTSSHFLLTLIHKG